MSLMGSRGRSQARNPTGRMPVQDPRFLRSQAEFCLKLAARISSAETAEHLRTAATRYVARADEIETDEPRSDGGLFTPE
jgi:hypothetical protein